MMALGTMPFSISFQRGVLRPNEFFRRIRDCALDILCGAYRRPSNLSERLKIVGALDGSVPHIAPSFPVSVETRAWLEPDCIRTTRFLYEVTIPGAELPVVDAVAKWLWQARRFSSDQDDELERLQQLREHRLYQLYGVLIVWHRSAEDDNPTNWRAVGQRRQQAVERYLEGLSPATMERAIRDLKIIAEQFELSHAFESIRSSPAYVDVLRRARDWTLREDVWFRHEAPRILKGLAGGLQTPLYGVLMEWVESGDIRKLKEVASILRGYNVGGPFYDLCREIICRTDKELILGSIAAAIGSTPEGGVQGGMSHFHTQRLEEVSPWLRDEHFRVRHFAERMRQSLQREIEREQAFEEFERRQWS